MLRTLIAQSRVIIATLAMLLVAGAYGYSQIPKEANPDIPIPTMYVSLAYQGIAPEDAVNQLLKPMEKQLRGLSGLDELEGTAFEGGANLIIKFQAGFDPKSALADVRAKVDLAKADLPNGAEEPTVNEINLSLFPILTVVLSGDVPERALKRYAEDLQDVLEGLPGVLEAPINGLREEALLIELNQAQLESYKLTLPQVLQAVQANNSLVAAGSLELAEGKYAVKVPGLFRTPLDLLNLPLAAVGDKVIRVRDVGEVKLTFKDAVGVSRVDGQSALTINVKKRLGENIISTVESVKTAVEEHTRSWPPHLSVRFMNDESKNIQTMLNDLENNVVISTLLVLVVVLLALGWRGAALVAMTVPASFLAALLLLYVLGFTTNVVVLFALILSVGILVDGAIVVAEMAEQNLQAGKSVKESYMDAAEHMAMPVLTSTLTILAAFLPLLFWPDVVGQFMRFMPITMFYVLIASWFMAMIYLPALGILLPPAPVNPNPPDDIYAKAGRAYETLLVKVLKAPGRVVAGAVAGMVVVIALTAVAGAGVEFFPRIEPDRVQLVVHAKGDLSLANKDALVREVEALVGRPDGVESIITSVGNSGGRNEPSDVVGNLTLELAGWETGRPTSDIILKNALAKANTLPGLWVEQKIDREGPQQGKPVQLLVTGPDMASIRPVALALKEALRQIPGTRDITDNMPEPGIEWTLTVNRTRASQLGTDLAGIGQTVRLATNGAIVGTYRPNDRKEELDIVARLKADERTLTTLDRMTVATATGRVPVGDVTTRTATPKVDVVHRQDQKTAVTVESDLQEGALASTIVEVVREGLKTQKMPPGVDVVFKGDQSKQDTAANFLKLAFAVAVFLIALIMLVEFNSFYQCFVVLTAVMFSTMGVMLGHLITGKPFGIIMSGLGIIALAGIMVSNNIVLIDAYNGLRKKSPWKKALLDTCRQRLRPVLLTQITTAIGLLPLALKINLDVINRSVSYNAPSAQWWDQLAVAIIFGCVFGTVLTLVVTPCMLALPELWKERRKK
ncbi:MAG: efflux RND transporter permease subunit [Alphaproteobacteria bacterium]